MNNLTVPFVIDNISHGLQKAGGLLKWEEDRLILEFQVEDAIVGLFKSDVEEVTIPISELQGVEFKKNIFSAKLIIEARSMKTMRDIPGSEQATCTMKIKRGDRDKASRLVSRIQLALSEYRLDQME